MTYDFFMGQLRLVVIAIIAYGSGKGWFTTADASLITAILTPIGLIAGPWIWSLYRNTNMKLVPKDSVPISADQARVSVDGTHAVITGAQTTSGETLARVVGVLLVAFVLSAFLAGGAQAQTVRKPQVTGDIVADTKANFGAQQNTAVGAPPPTIKPQELMQKIVALAAPDLVYAVALATKANTNAATVRLGCLKAIQALNAQVSGTGLTGPDGNPLTVPAEPHIFTDLEQAAEGIDALSPTGPLFTSCAGAAALAGMNVLAFINAMVAGTAAAAIVVPK